MEKTGKKAGLSSLIFNGTDCSDTVMINVTGVTLLPNLINLSTCSFFLFSALSFAASKGKETKNAFVLSCDLFLGNYLRSA